MGYVILLIIYVVFLDVINVTVLLQYNGMARIKKKSLSLLISEFVDFLFFKFFNSLTNEMNFTIIGD
jgi:hypothetical protein